MSIDSNLPTKTNMNRIGVIADGDANHPMTMSGTPYFMVSALRHVVPQVEVLPCRYQWLEQSFRYLNGGMEKVTKRRYSRAHSVLLARLRSADFAREARRRGCDALFSAKDCKGIAYLPEGLPVIYWTDATFASIHNYYPSFRRLYRFSEYEGDLLERRALRRAQAVVTLSDWARRSMIDDYGTAPEKIHVFPFGPKLPRIDEHAAESGKPPISQQLNLLWIGVNWPRKGGPEVFATFQELRRRGIPVELTIIGTNPSEVAGVEGVRVIRRLDKSKPEELARLHEEYRRAHLFFLPSRQEAAGSVYIEATAFGLPSIACETGGVSSMIRHETNGLLFPAETSPEIFADRIEALQRNPQEYWRLSRRTHAYHFSDANWGVWSTRIQNIAESIQTSGVRPSRKLSA
jgi:glycosyltransferase involved in cell wall biosynthesis